MKELQFETGLETYKVNDSCEISFNPGDISFVKKLFDLFDDLSKEQETKEKQVSDDVDPKELFKLTEQWDTEMRAKIDCLFGDGVCAALFQNTSVYAIAGGFPIWANFIMAIVDEIDTSLVVEEQKGRDRIDKYMKKYKKYMKK